MKDMFEISTQDQMKAIIKQINCNLANQPDFEKVATLLDQSVECKVWHWDQQKCHVFNKDDFSTQREFLESKNVKLECVVPFEVLVEEKGIIGTYVYYFKEDSQEERYLWICRCAYIFNKNLDIIKMSQFGEMYCEGGVAIPFEVNLKGQN